MNVLAKPGTQCPKEGRPREYITDLEAVDVPETAYYKRLVDDGSLTVVSGQWPVVSEKQTESKKKGGKD